MCLLLSFLFILTILFIPSRNHSFKDHYSFKFFWFYLVSILCPWIHIPLSHDVSLGSSRWWRFLRLSLFWIAVPSLSHVPLFATPWTATHQATLSFTIPRVCSNSCPLSRWCHPTISSSVVPFSFLSSVFLSIRVFSNVSALRIRWPKYWNFNCSVSSFQWILRTDFL